MEKIQYSLECLNCLLLHYVGKILATKCEFYLLNQIFCYDLFGMQFHTFVYPFWALGRGGGVLCTLYSVHPPAFIFCCIWYIFYLMLIGHLRNRFCQKLILRVCLSLMNVISSISTHHFLCNMKFMAEKYNQPRK